MGIHSIYFSLFKFRVLCYSVLKPRVSLSFKLQLYLVYILTPPISSTNCYSLRVSDYIPDPDEEIRNFVNPHHIFIQVLINFPNLSVSPYLVPVIFY